MSTSIKFCYLFPLEKVHCVLTTWILTIKWLRLWYAKYQISNIRDEVFVSSIMTAGKLIWIQTKQKKKKRRIKKHWQYRCHFLCLDTRPTWNYSTQNFIFWHVQHNTFVSTQVDIGHTNRVTDVDVLLRVLNNVETFPISDKTPNFTSAFSSDKIIEQIFMSSFSVPF